ncbi:MAG: GNAT family N-acetyltransferase [Rhodoferax sp.]|nr:GNAT family N-acetyltransferase [Rhodoferax sp.]
MQTLGVARAIVDPDNIEAEFGVIVRSELKGQGLGSLLMDKLIAYLRGHGTQRLVATVLGQNDRMLRLSKQQGFQERPHSEGGDGTKSLFLTLKLKPARCADMTPTRAAQYSRQFRWRRPQWPPTGWHPPPLAIRRGWPWW